MSSVYLFSEETLQQALDDWKTRVIRDNPTHQDTIETTVVAMREFFNSNEVIQHKMIMTIDPTEATDDATPLPRSRRVCHAYRPG